MLIGITGEVEGNVVYGVHLGAPLDIAGKMMGQPQKQLDDLSEAPLPSWETSSRAMRRPSLKKTRSPARFTPLSLIIGKGTRIQTAGIPRLIIPLDIGFGEIEIGVSLREGRKDGAGELDEVMPGMRSAKATPSAKPRVAPAPIPTARVGFAA